MVTKRRIERVINRSYAYALPMVALPHNLKLDDFTNFKGAYLFHEKYPELTERIYLHFDSGDGTRGHKQLLQLLEISNYLDFVEYPDSFSVLFCFRIPEEYKREYEKLMQSKYSEFSENYKRSIIKFHKLESSTNPARNKKSVINVLYRTEEGYLAKEEYINEGLPNNQWTRIPRDIEIGALMEEIRDAETFRTGPVEKYEI